MKVDLPLGDVVDKVTILRIKKARIADAAKVANVERELAVLLAGWATAGLPEMTALEDYAGLAEVNEKLWVVEDELRDHERRRDFGPAFVRLARSVYHLNDGRAARKRSINVALGSALVEEKSYADYGDGGDLDL
ncbi:MAG: hypothetical protein VX265_11795 [Myxococcota bacterium]|nr:hypothetical protein [Myxococcota bacterium]MEC8423646.1 hypothetical protein [Myxococcota bacterium]